MSPFAISGVGGELGREVEAAAVNSTGHGHVRTGLQPVAVLLLVVQHSASAAAVADVRG